jgi:protein-disulfide isomerase
MRLIRTTPCTAAPALLAAIVTLAAGCAGDTQAGAAPSAEIPAPAVAYHEGPTSAPVHVIYFADYVCDDCAKFSAAAVEPLRTDWVAKNRAQLTVVDLAWHRGSVAGSAAAVCAAEQGQFWPMHTMLFERQEIWKRAVDIPAKLTEYAGKLGLDTAKFAPCVAEKRHRDRLDAAEEATKRYAVRGTPAFVINGKLYYGSQSWEWIEQVLLANERGQPDSAPPPPFNIPTKRVVDSARLKELQDSAAGQGGEQ